eukprot:GHVN01075454.1.p1 GENE.GHVN01075454.1~~GHVN01075454.1.p1  ORF type:complete len:282 (-),score=48.61 GHVN01075454.1:172-1017(-)
MQRRRINTLIEEKQHYDAFMVVKSLYSRELAKGNYQEAVSLAFEFAVEFANHHNYDIAVDLGLLMIAAFYDGKLEPTNERVEKVVELINLLPPFCQQKNNFVEKAVKWTKSEDEPEGSARLHTVAAQVFIAQKEFGQAQGHLVFAGTADELADLYTGWKKFVFRSESSMLLARMVMMLLCLNRVSSSFMLLCELEERKVIDFEDSSVDAPLQFTYFLVAAARSRNYDFYQTVKAKYFLVIRRDEPCFDKMLAQIEDVIFNKPRQQEKGLLSMLMGVMGGGD